MATRHYRIEANVAVQSDKIAGIIDLARKKRGGRSTDTIPNIQAALEELFDLIDRDHYSVYSGLRVGEVSAYATDDEEEAKYTCAVCNPDVADPDVDHCNRCQKEGQ